MQRLENCIFFTAVFLVGILCGNVINPPSLTGSNGRFLSLNSTVVLHWLPVGTPLPCCCRSSPSSSSLVYSVVGCWKRDVSFRYYTSVLDLFCPVLFSRLATREAAVGGTLHRIALCVCNDIGCVHLIFCLLNTTSSNQQNLQMTNAMMRISLMNTGPCLGKEKSTMGLIRVFMLRVFHGMCSANAVKTDFFSSS